MVRFWRGLSLTLLALCVLPGAPAGAAPSDVDASFGTQGSATVPFAPDFAEGYDSVLQANGGIVIVGNKGGDHMWPVARLTAGGQPDASFDGDGKLILPVQGLARAVTQQADGKLLVAGSEGTGFSGQLANQPRFVVARLNADGSPDGGFGTSGIARTTLAAGEGWTATPKAIAVQPDGKIVVAGSSPEGGEHVTLVRYGTDGVEDPGFGAGGVVQLRTPGGDSRAEAVLIDPAGNVAVAGFGADANGDRVALLARFTPSGAPDATFGTGGFTLADWHTGDDIESVATGLVRQPSGKLVAGGTTEIEGTPGFAIARYGDDGQPDPSFGEAGITRTDVGYGSAEALVRDPGGKLLLAGWADTAAPGEYEALARYDADGAPDAGFGSGGLVTHQVGTTSTHAADVHVQPADGRIVVTGFAGSAFSASRFAGDPPPPDPGGDDPGGTDGPGTDDSEGCTSEVRRLLLVARAACFRDDGDWKVSEGPVRLNGLDLVPVDGTVIRIHPSDFRLRTQAPGGGIGIVELRAGTVPLARQGFDVGVGSALAFRAAESASIDGFRIAGDVNVTFSQEGEAGLDGTISTPFVSGALKARLRMDGGLAVDTLTLDVPGFDYGALGTVEPLHLAFSPGGGWSGSAGFRLGHGQNALGFGGRMTAADGNWREVSGTAGVLPLGVIPVRDVSFTIRRTASGMQVAGSGRVPVGGFGGLDAMRMEGAVSADVPLSLGDLQDFAWRLRGTATLFETAALVGGELRWDDRRPTFTGQAEWGLHAGQFRNLGSGGVAALATPLDATVSAKARYADAQASGSGTAKIFGLGVGVDMSYGSRGIGACGDVRVGLGPLSAVVRGGATVSFHPTRYAALIGACDIAALSSASAAAAGARPVRLPGGRRVGVLVVRGKGAPPRLRVSGPGGAGLTMTKSRKPQRRGRFLVLQEPGRDTTYVLVAKPRGGRWSVRALPGSAAVRSVMPAAALPPIRVTGKVTRGKGRTRVLRWRGKGVPGHVLRFREIGGGVNGLLRSTRKAKGRLTFTPARGGTGVRRIVAVAERGGVPRTTLRVARFKP